MRGAEQTQEVGALAGGKQTWPIVERPIEMLIGDWGGIGGDAGVAAGRSGRGGAADAVGEGGEEQEAAGGEGAAPGAGDAHVGEDAVDFVNDGLDGWRLRSEQATVAAAGRVSTGYRLGSN